jgi:tRNA-2-methylthio-N6-dimethylallyladenosine synthase
VQGATYFLETFGCQMNILDSQLIEGQLRARGLTPVSDYRDADVILLNTCSVRQHAEDKVLSRLGHMKRLKRRRSGIIVGVVGCMAERVREELFVQAPQVDLICGPGELDRLPVLIDEIHEHRRQLAALAENHSRRTRPDQRAHELGRLEALDLARSPSLEANVLQSYVRVQRGCDKFCTYCVVPYVRGPERSRPPGNIVAEACRLAEAGCREITLLGQTVNSYVYDEDGRAVTFAKLLERVHGVEGLDRIRFVTSYPADWDEDIFRVMRDYPRVMPYLHLPAQSGSDRILKAMRRTYSASSYLGLIDTARKYVPDMALAGDCIVGFCGESEEDFQQTVDLVRRVQYESLFIFKYSPRPGTKADRLADDDVPPDVKARRNNDLLAIQSEISHRRKQTLIGQKVEVLVEGPSKAARKAQGEGRTQQRTRGKHSPTFSRRSASRSGPQTQRPTESGAPPLPGVGDGRADERSAAHDSVPHPQRGWGTPASRSGPQTRHPETQEPTTQARRSGPQTRHPETEEPTTQLVARTPGDLMVIFDTPTDYVGAIVKVRIESASPHTLFGRVTEMISPARDSR